MNKKRSVLICAAMIITVIAVFWLIPFHWWLLGMAAFVIFSGTGLTPLFEEPKERTRRKWRKSLFTGVAVTVGALLSTYAWDLRSQDLQKINLLGSLAEELSIDLHLLEDNLKDPRSEKPPRPWFTLPRTTVLNAIISSGRLDLGDAKEEKLFREVVNCERSLRTALEMFRSMNTYIVSHNHIESQVSVVEVKIKVARSSEWFNDSQNSLRSLIDLLRNEFGSTAEIEDSRVEEQDAIQDGVDP